MTKQQLQKANQGYTDKIIPKTCSTCRHLKMDKVLLWTDTRTKKDYFRDKNLRCGIGGFAVKKMGGCSVWGGSVS